MTYDVSAELDVAWHLDDGAATLSNYNFGSSASWCAQVITALDWGTIAPGVPVISFFITGVSARVGKLSSSTANIGFNVYRVAAGKPTGSSLDSVTLANANIPVVASVVSTQPPWSGPLAMTASTPPTFAASESFAIVFIPTAGSCCAGCQTGGTNQSPTDQTRYVSSTSGGVWSISSGVDVIIEVFGRYNTVPGLVPPVADGTPVTNAIAGGAGSTSHSFAVTIGNNPDRCLWVPVMEGPDTAGTAPDVCSGATYAGLPMDLIYDLGRSERGSYERVFRLKNPPVGTDNVVTSYPGTNHKGSVAALSYYNVDLTQPEGAMVLLFGSSTGTALPPFQMLAVLGDTNLVALAWDSPAGASTASPQSAATVTIGGSETAPSGGEGAVVGRSIGDVYTGYQLSGVGKTGDFAYVAWGILSTTGLHSQFAPPPPDYSQYPKQLLRTVADPDIHNDPDDGI